MNITSSQSGHWTDDELLAHIYGIGPSGNHLQECADCRSRLSAMQSNRQSLETAEQVGNDFLAAQRRAIYRRIERREHWWNSLAVRRWAAGMTTACVLGGALFMYDQNRQMRLAQERVNDARLMQEVATMASDTSTSSMAPLEGLFE